MRKTFITLTAICVLLACVSLAMAATVYPPSPFPRRDTQAVFANGKLHWIGGQGTAVTDANNVTFDANRQTGYSLYDPTTNTWNVADWDTYNDKPQNPSGIDLDGDGIATNGTYPGSCQNFAYDYDADGTEEIFIHAGYPVWNDDFYVYDPDTNKWSEVGGKSPFNSGYSFCQYAGIAALDKDTRTVWCFGGAFGDHNFYSYQFATPGPKPANGTWTKQATAPFGVVSSMGAVVNSKLYVFGGNQNSAWSTAIWSCDVSNPASPVWSSTKIADLATTSANAGIGVYNGKIYIIGGRDNSQNPQTLIQVFDPATGTVTKLGDLPIPLARNGGVIAPDGTLYAGGGITSPNNVMQTKWWKTNVNVTPLVWTQIPDDPANFGYNNWYPGGAKLSGTVYGPDGMPMPMAIVGIKKQIHGGNAAADASFYVKTDAHGKYSFNLRAYQYNVAAWAYGFTPSADKALNMTDVPTTLDFNLTTKAGKNIAPGSTYYITCKEGSTGETTGEPAKAAVDGNLGTRWASDSGGEDVGYIVDLGTSKTLTGITTVWEYARPFAYSIDVTNGDPNPAANPTWTNIYTSDYGSGGWFTGRSAYFDPIRFNAPMNVRGIRFHCTKYSAGLGNYSTYDFILHGTEPSDICTSVAEAKSLADGTPVELLKRVAFSSEWDGGVSAAFKDRYWYEELDRSNGIRVDMASHGCWAGEWDQVTGTVQTDPATGERYIAGTSVVYLADPDYSDPNYPVAPLAMNNKNLDSKAAWGKKVKTTGKITERIMGTDPTSGADIPVGYKITDGSGSPVTVISDVTPLAVGTQVTVTGMLSGNRTIYAGRAGDGTIRTWLFNGGYSVARPTNASDTDWQLANLDQDFLGGEAAIQPKPGDAGPNGAAWFVKQLALPDFTSYKSDTSWNTAWNWNFDLGTGFKASGQGQTCVYASTWVYADREYNGSWDNLTFKTGSDDGYRLWLNGKVINTVNLGRGNTRDSDIIQNLDPMNGGDLYVLKPGWNHILMKINNISGGYGFTFRMTYLDGETPLNLPTSVVPWGAPAF